MIKSELRKIYLAKRKNLSPIERNQKSEQISNNFFQAFDLSKIRFLHCFVPIEKFNEVDTNLIFQRIWREFLRLKTIAPRVNFQTHEIENVKFTRNTALVKNAWQISEPTENELVESKEIDLVLAPLLCFDERGFRVGYGKGFYDKFLKNCRKDCLKIGLSFFASVEEITDAQDFDVRLDFCITTQEVIKTKI